MINKLLNNPKNHLIIFFVILLGCILLLLGRLYKTSGAIGGDAVYYYSNLRSIVIDRDINLENEYEYFHNQRSKFTGNRKIPIIPDKNQITGRFPAKYPIGNTLFLIPPFLLTHNILFILQMSGVSVTTDGYSLIYQATAATSSLLYAFLGLLLVYKLGRKIFEPKIAFWGTLFIWLATPLVYYMTMEPLTSQPLSFFCVSAVIYLWYSNRENRTLYNWILLGIVGGLMSIIRYQDALFLLLPLTDNLRRFSATFFYRLVFLVSTGLVISIQLSINNYLYGSPFHASVYGDMGFPYLASPKIFYTLFSLERGLFVWAPILSFAGIGLYWFIKKFKTVGGLLLLAFLLQVYVVSSWVDPTQGDSFGNRILINSNSIFALGLMQFLKEVKTFQKLFLAILSGFVLINNILIILFVFRIIGQPY